LTTVSCPATGSRCCWTGTSSLVGDYERHRNAAVFARQGNRNPLVDHPEWASDTDFTRGLTGDHT
jgi:endonuclease I